MLKVCVIGMGHIGNLHARLLHGDELAEVVGVCDLDAQRAEAGSKTHEAPGFTDTEAMLKACKPDIVHICTGGYEYGSEHHLPTMQALRAGCHVLGEKPISNTIAEAEEMVEFARDAGLCYGIDLNHRFTPAARLAKTWQNEGKLGSLLFCNMAMWIGNPRESSPWFHIKALHPHTVDIMRHFCGDITHVHCFATKAPGRAIWSTAQFNLKFANGCVGSLTGSYDIQRGHPMERCEVAGTQGRFIIDDMWREATLYPVGDAVKQVYTNPVFGGYGGFDDTFRERIHTFLKQVDTGVAPDDIDGKASDALEAQRVLSAAIISIEEERVVAVEEARGSDCP